jgi:nickel transport system substrate-binding protein
MKRALNLFALLILSMIVISCGSNKTNKEEPKEKTLVFANFRDIRDLNPHLYAGELFAQNLLFESLVKIDTDGSFKPWLAESWTISDDGKTYVFKLREDVSFSDGEKFNAEAAKKNFDAILSNLERHGWLESVRLMDEVNKSGGKAVEATGEYELTIRLSTSYYPFLVELGVIRPFRFISPKAFINGTTKDGVSSLSGTGKYILKENHKDQYAVFEANPNYWGEKPQIQKIIAKVIPDNQARVMALEKGEIDLLFGANLVDAETYNKFKDKEGFGGAMSDPVSTRMLLINTADATVGDLNVRKAIEHAINKKEISEGIFDGIETPADTILDKTVPYADISLTPYEYNIQKSETLLEEAGWKKSNSSKFRQKNGQELKITLSYNSNNPIDKTIGEYMQGELAKIGINLELQGEEEQANRDRMKAGKFQIVFNISWGKPYDPQSFLGGMRNPVYGDYLAQQGLKDKKEIDTAILNALESTDEAKRKEYYKFVLTRLHEEAVYIPITNERNRAIFSSKVKNVGFEISKYEVPMYNMDVE